MNKYYIGGIAVLAAVALFFAGHSFAPAPKLGSYTNGGVINGNVVVNGLVQGSLGFNPTLNTSTALTPTQFCQTTNMRWVGQVAATATLPSATSSYLACTGGFGNYGAWNGSYVSNDGTTTVNFVAGTGDSFLCEDQGAGTSTVIGGCTTSQFSVLASTTVYVTGYWDNTSSSLYILVGNSYFN
jgi:hypothetical protein